MSDEYTFDWQVRAPIEAVADQVEAACAARQLGGLWYESAPAGRAVKGCRITADGQSTLAVLTLQEHAPETTRLRLQPAARAADLAPVLALAETLYAALVGFGWLPGAAPAGPAPRQLP